MANRPSASLAEAFERALGEIWTRISVSAAAYLESSALAIAYSGGLDSSVLLHLAQAYAQRHGIRLYAFHIHHGLSPHADAWLAHCRDECARLGIGFDARRILVSAHRMCGVEEAARLARYAALGDLCRQYGISMLLTAHHQDDQAETVLLQLLRGAGVAGLSGMDAVNAAPALLGDESLRMARPLLGVARAELAEFAFANGIAHVDDESNADSRYARNALRHQVMPVLEKVFPGAAHRIARSAGHAQAAHALLQEVAAQDLAACAQDGSIDLRRLSGLSDARIDNVLRYWLMQGGFRMPSTAWLAEMRAQVFSAQEDARVCVTHPEVCIRRHRGRIFLTAHDEVTKEAEIGFRWSGESEIRFPSFRGTLHFEGAEQGIDPAWLREQELLLHWRRGGERLKPAPNRPTRSLKHHYQSRDIPAWERERLPLLSAAGRLVYAAGIGMDCHCPSREAGVVLRWEADPASLSACHFAPQKVD